MKNGDHIQFRAQGIEFGSMNDDTNGWRLYSLNTSFLGIYMSVKGHKSWEFKALMKNRLTSLKQATSDLVG